MITVSKNVHPHRLIVESIDLFCGLCSIPDPARTFSVINATQFMS